MTHRFHSEKFTEVLQEFQEKDSWLFCKHYRYSDFADAAEMGYGR